MKYKENDYIVVTGKATDNLVGKTVRVHKCYPHDGDYMIDTMLPEMQFYPLWSAKSCEDNSHLNITMTVLYNERPQPKTN